MTNTKNAPLVPETSPTALLGSAMWRLYWFVHVPMVRYSRANMPEHPLKQPIYDQPHGTFRCTAIKARFVDWLWLSDCYSNKEWLYSHDSIWLEMGFFYRALFCRESHCLFDLLSCTCTSLPILLFLILSSSIWLVLNLIHRWWEPVSTTVHFADWFAACRYILSATCADLSRWTLGDMKL